LREISVAIPFHLGQVSTYLAELRKTIITAGEPVAIPFHLGQVSTYAGQSFVVSGYEFVAIPFHLGQVSTLILCKSYKILYVNIRTI